jgi:two-component system cell cycle sensor histidine kinase/response regulator CckA
MLFKADGYTVLQAADGETALNLIRENRDSIILLVTDLGLPRLGGFELIKEARKVIPSLKIIAASGFGHANIRSELRAVGVEEFFPKPFEPLELLATAKRLIAVG